MGHEVSFYGLTKSPEKIEAILKAKVPQDKKELRSFLGLAGFCRAYVPRFAEITAPLSNLLSKRVSFQWNKECQYGFEMLRQLIAEKVILSSPTAEGTFGIYADASDVGAGSVLLQWQEKADDWVILEFASVKFTTTQKNWDTIEREAFAIKWSVKRFQHYLYGSHTVIFTDSSCLAYIAKSEKPKLIRWSLFLQSFDISIKTVKGTHQLADYFSRSFVDPEEEKEIDDICVPEIFYAQAELCCNPPRLPNIADLSDVDISVDSKDRRYITHGEDGVYYHIHGGQVYIPKKWRNDIIAWFHASRYGAHAGVSRTKRLMRKLVWWPGWNKDVETFIRGCLICARFAGEPKVRTTLATLSKPLPLELISIDFMGQHELAGESVCICVIIDHCTRFMQCKKFDGPTAENAICFLSDSWITPFGYPSAILCDRGSAFTSARFRNFVNDDLCARLIYTSPYYPQGNSINESCHRVINKAVKTHIAQFGVQSFKGYRDIALLHNACPISLTGVSPYYYMFGFEPTFPGWSAFRESTDSATRLLKLNEARFRRLVGIALEEQYCNDSNNFHKPNIGSWVVYPLTPLERKGPHMDNLDNITEYDKRGPFKWSPTWSLPAKVIQIQDNVAFVRDLGIDRKLRQMPFSKLRVLPTRLPSALQDLNLRLIEATCPQRLRDIWRSRILQPSPPTDITIDQLIDSAFQPRKRARREIIPVLCRPRPTDPLPIGQQVEGGLMCPEA